MGPVLQMRRLRLRERKGLVQVYSIVQPGLGPSLGDPKAMFYCSIVLIQGTHRTGSEAQVGPCSPLRTPGSRRPGSSPPNWRSQPPGVAAGGVRVVPSTVRCPVAWAFLPLCLGSFPGSSPSLFNDLKYFKII